MKLDSFGCLIPGCNANDVPNATMEEQPEMKLAIYPNPTSDFLNFELRTPRLLQRAIFRIVDANGKVVKELQSDSPRDTFIVPVRDWAAGVYFLQYLENNEVRAVERFVVGR
jgi:Secretion system C-terminal sorting domain